MILKLPAKAEGRVEVVRSFSYKLNVGNYESRDFFCSAKAQCDAAEMEEVGVGLDDFVQDQVLTSVKQYSKKIEHQRKGKVA